MEPYRLRKWKTGPSPQDSRLFTCARPGRSKGKVGRIPDTLVHKWVQGLPKGTDLVIVSLLGRKNGPDGKSEFSFYSFHGKLDGANERRNRLSFQDWLDHWHMERSLRLVEFPTYDFCPIAPTVLAAISEKISHLLAQHCIVVLMDSGGEQRTGEVCRHMGFVEDTRPNQSPLPYD
jgi:hypothetical protein